MKLRIVMARQLRKLADFLLIKDKFPRFLYWLANKITTEEAETSPFIEVIRSRSFRQ